MKRSSKYFDSIRVKPDEDRLLRNAHPECEWQGCANAGTNRAPKGRGLDGEYHLYCIDHVREYNKSYNYFDGMNNKDVGLYQKAALTGHRPTWTMGMNKRPHNKKGTKSQKGKTAGFADAFGFFADDGTYARKPKRQIRNAERKALVALNLDETAEPKQIKAQYKMLVKRHHPDANGGGKIAEEKLREIIQAYDYLKRAGFLT